MIKPRLPVWPRHIAGGATPLTRARTIARALYKAGKNVPTVEAVAEQARRFGETWLDDTTDTGARVLSRAEAAEVAGVRPPTIRKWVQRGFIHPLPSGGYDYDELLGFLASKRDTPTDD